MISPFILINLKTYREGTGQQAHRIASAAQAVASDSGVVIGIAPSYIDIHPLAHHYELPVYAQHVDGADPGAHMGTITAEALRLAGASGSLVNHSERRLTLADIDASLSGSRFGRSRSRCRVPITKPLVRQAQSLSPDYVAIEPPE